MIDIRIDAQRIEQHLQNLAHYSDAPAPAVTRILYTEKDQQARGLIRDLMRESGLQIREDAIGNIFGRWIGTHPNLPSIATGSHTDAIPFSGMYDGTVGVIGAIEAIRALREAGFQPMRSLDVIMFTSEEPTRFGIGCLGSRAMAGILTPDDLLALRDDAGEAFDTVRQSAGYTAPLHTVQLKPNSYHAFVELHIEQGPRLEDAGDHIGIVTAIAAPATLRVIIEGDGGHAGTVLMPRRKDALTAAAEIILEVERAARQSDSPDAVATVGRCEVYPEAVNSIPSRVLLEIDVRDIDLASRDSMIEQIRNQITQTCDARQLQADMSILNANKPCYAGETIQETLVKVTEELGYRYQLLVSRAYHDALFMAELCPVSMIFVPSLKGYSHRPEEFTALDDIVKGVTVLAHSLAQLSNDSQK